MFIYTKHAVEKMDALGIEKREVEQAIIQGMKWKENERDVWNAKMAGVEVVFQKQDKNFIIITTYYSGSEK